MAKDKKATNSRRMATDGVFRTGDQSVVTNCCRKDTPEAIAKGLLIVLKLVIILLSPDIRTWVPQALKVRSLCS